MRDLEPMSEDAKMDMTPMIDCVFLLLIFFVLVIDLSQQDLEDLVLPKAEFIEPDDQPPAARPIINIMQDGRVVYRGNCYYDPTRAPDDWSKLRALLVSFKDEIAKDKTERVVGGRTIEVVNDPILIRADKWTEWHFVAKVMEHCSPPEAAFWKLELALSEVDKEKRR